MKDFPALLERDDVKTIAVHDMALDEVRKMFVACEKVAADHGHASDEYRQMVTSLHKCLSALFTVGYGRHTYVTRDGDLSLYIQDGPMFVMGMVFHRNRLWDNPPEGHQQPGTWSLHS